MIKKRFMAVFMAALFLINTVPFFGLELRLEAATGLTANFSQLLSGNVVGSNAPELVTGDHGVNAFFAQFNVDAPYRFTYLHNPTTRIDFELTPSPTGVEGRFRLFTWSTAGGGAWVQTSNSGMEIYNYIEGWSSGGIGWRPADEFTTTGPNPGGGPGRAEVREDLAGGVLTNDAYYFFFDSDRFVTAQGFSIRVNNHEISFRMDGDTFQYTAGMAPGFVYQLNLLNLDAALAPTTIADRAYVVTGLDVERVDFIPIASDKVSGGLPYVISDAASYGTGPHLRNDRYILAANEDPSRFSDTTPGTANAGMVIRFDEPMVLSYAGIIDTAVNGSAVALGGPAYSRANAGSRGGVFDVEITMQNNLSATPLMVSALDIHSMANGSLSANNTSVTGSSPFNPVLINSSSTVEILPYTPLNGAPGVGRRIQITLNNLLPGMISDNPNVYFSALESTNEIRSGAVRAQSGSAGIGNLRGVAFTFLEYEFVMTSFGPVVRFTPYQGVPGRYRVELTTPAGDVNNAVSPIRDSDGITPIMETLGTVTPDMRVQIKFERSGVSAEYDNRGSWVNTVYSERILYDPANLPFELGPARDFSIDDYTLKPNLPGSSPEGFVDLELSWSIGSADAIEMMYNQAQALAPGEPLIIKYALLKSITGDPLEDDIPEFGFAYIEIRRNAASPTGFEHRWIIFDAAPGGIDRATFEDDTFGSAAADAYASANPSHVRGMSLLPGGTPGFIPLGGAGVDGNILRLRNIKLDNVPAVRAWPTPPSPMNPPGTRFYFDRVYFLGVQTLIEAPPADNRSNFESMTLSDIIRDPQVPPVRDLGRNPYQEEAIPGHPLGRHEARIQWWTPAARLRDYFAMTPFDPDEADISFNLFISQDEAEIRRLATLTEEQLRGYVNTGALTGFPTMARTQYNAAAGPNRFSLTDYISALRNYETLAIREIPLVVDNEADWINFLSGVDGVSVNDPRTQLELLNLDENQTYYIYVSAVVTHRDIEDVAAGILPTVRMSMLSSLYGFTTRGTPDPPDGTDLRPPAPTLRIYDVAIDSARVEWDHPIRPLLEGEVIYYEIIRTRTDPLPASIYNNASSGFPDLFQSIRQAMPDLEFVVMRTPNDPPATGRLQQLHANGVNVSESDFHLTITEAGVRLIDRSLISNEIYYYYVRTVRVVREFTDDEPPIFVGQKELRSVFNFETLTTDPVSAPRNLRILDRSEAAFDPMREFVINFDAPLTNPQVSLGTDYNIEASIRVDNGAFGEPFVLTVADLLANVRRSTGEGLEDYSNFTYRITDREPNTMYSIRVRMVNIRTGDTSSWSNVAITRTDVDQEGIFDDRSLDNWLRFYRDMLGLLIVDPFWTVQDNTAGFAAVYRPTMFNGLVNTGADGRIILPKGEAEANRFIYYLPASSLAMANDNNRGFILQHSNVEVLISPNTVSTQTNESIIEITNRISRRQITDYYLRVDIEFKAHNLPVHGNPALSDNIIISFELVGALQRAVEFDNLTLVEYTRAIERELLEPDVRETIREFMRDETTQSEEIIRFLTVRKSVFRNLMISETNTRFRAGLGGGNIGLRELDAPLLIALNNADVTVNATGYFWENNMWAVLDTFPFATSRAFRSSVTGSFIFAGVVINIPGSENMPGALTAFTIIGRFGLTDFLGHEGNIDLNAAASRQAVLGSAARMMGAPRGSDPVQFLRGRGYNVSGARLNDAATIQESIFIVMAVYEVRNNTNLATIQVRNFNALNGITGINEIYRPAIRAAHDLGIHDVTGMNPRANTTIRQLLEMLTALDNRAQL